MDKLAYEKLTRSTYIVKKEKNSLKTIFSLTLFYSRLVELQHPNSESQQPPYNYTENKS